MDVYKKYLSGDHHYGKEMHTRDFFVKKQKAIYPIIALCGLGLCGSVILSISNVVFNKNVVISRPGIATWNKEQRKTAIDKGFGGTKKPPVEITPVTPEIV